MAELLAFHFLAIPFNAPAWKSRVYVRQQTEEFLTDPYRQAVNSVWHHRPMGHKEKGVVMKGFVQDIEGLAIKNSEFRRVLYTAKHCQLVVMALKPKEEIGAEVHKLDP